MTTPTTCPHCGLPLTPAPRKGRPPKERDALAASIVARFAGTPFAAADVRGELGAGPAETKRALEALEAQGRAVKTGESKPVGKFTRAALWMITAPTTTQEESA